MTGWLSDNNKFCVRYYNRENGGKHRAINFGVQVARGELFFIVDSDEDVYKRQTLGAFMEYAQSMGALVAEIEVFDNNAINVLRVAVYWVPALLTFCLLYTSRCV